MSPRSRSGGKVTVVTRSARASRGRNRRRAAVLEVAISRTSTELEPLQPTGRTSPVASTRSSVPAFPAAARRSRRAAGCRIGLEQSSAAFRRRRPGRRRDMAEQLLSMILAATALQSTMTIGPRARRLAVDGAGEGFLAGAGLADDQDRQAVAGGLGGDGQRGRKSGAAPISCSSDRSGRASPTAGEFARGAAAVGVAASASSSRSGATGLARKSEAPARIASTAARSTPPSARTMIGKSGARAKRGDQARAVALVPAARIAARTSRPCGTLEQADGGLAGRRRRCSSPARDASAARQPALVGVGIDQQQ